MPLLITHHIGPRPSCKSFASVTPLTARRLCCIAAICHNEGVLLYIQDTYRWPQKFLPSYEVALRLIASSWSLPPDSTHHLAQSLPADSSAMKRRLLLLWLLEQEKLPSCTVIALLDAQYTHSILSISATKQILYTAIASGIFLCKKYKKSVGPNFCREGHCAHLCVTACWA